MDQPVTNGDLSAADRALLFELADNLVAAVDGQGRLLQLAPKWSPGNGPAPERLHDLVAATAHADVDAALQAARDTGRARFGAHPATGGDWFDFRLGGCETELLVSAAPEGPGPWLAEAIARHTSVGLILIDADGRFDYVNDAYCALAGFSPEQLLGQPFTMALPESARAQAMAHHRHVIRNEPRNGARELRLRRGDGAIVPIASHDRRIDLPDGRTLRLATVVDVSRMHSDKRRRAEAEARLRDITDTLPGAVYQLCRLPDGSYRTTFMSEGFRHLAGLDPSVELADLDTVLSLLPGADAQRALELSAISARDLTPYQQEFALHGPAGARWIQARAQPHPREDGAVVWNGLMIDISERKAAEDRLAETEARLRAINEALPGAIYQVQHGSDGRSTFTYMSEGLKRICGLPDASALDFEAFIALVPEAEREGLLAAVRRSVETLVPLHHEFPLRGPRRTVWMEARSVPARQADGCVVCNGLMVDVTERRAARADADRLNAILQSTPDCVAITDTAGRMRYFNAGGRTLLELDPGEDVTGRSFFDFVAAGDAARIRRRATREAIRHGSWEGEVTVITSRGREIPVSQIILCHRDPNGRIDRFSTIIRDLSERVAVERELRASEERSRRLYHRTPTLLYSIDAEGRLIAVSDYWLEYMGYERAEVLGRESLDFFTEESRERALREVRPLFWREGSYRNVPFQVRRRDGEVRDMLLSADCERGPHGAVLQTLAVMVDVTEQVAAQRQLEASEARYRALYDRTPTMLHSIDGEGRLVHVSAYWLEHLGYSHDEVIGRRSTDFLTAESRRYAEEVVLPAFRRDGRCVDVPYQVVRRDGEVRDVLLSANAELDPSGAVERSLAVMVDVTEQRRAEADYRDIFEHATEGIYRSTPQGQLVRANPALVRMHGYEHEQELLDAFPDIAADWYVEPADRARMMELLRRDGRLENFEAEIYRGATGERLWTSENARIVRDRDGTIAYYEGTVRDITAQRQAALLTEYRGEILEMIARDRPLTGTLYEIVGLIEQQRARLTAAIFRLQRDRLYAAAAPALSNRCIEAVDGRTPADVGGAFAAAIETGQQAVDTAFGDADHAGTDFAEAVHASGYGAVAAVPVRDQSGAVLGILAAFAQYAGEIEGNWTGVLKEMAQIASIGIEQHRLSQALLRQAHYDPLTDLPNRSLLTDRLNQGVLDAARTGQRLAVLLLDLDEFKLVNDTLGHSAGDELLHKVSARLRNTLRAGDTVARLGGDEFVIVVPLHGAADATELAERVHAALQGSIHVGGRDVTARPSIGISIYPQDGDTTEALLQAADTAMYAAKNAGKNRYRYFAETMNTQVSERLRVEAELRAALAEDELELYFQPQIALADRTLVGAEALLRWARANSCPWPSAAL